MKVPAELKYTENDEWVRIEGDTGVVGITDYAQDQLSDIVYIEFMAEVGDTLDKGDTCVAVESVKAAADVYLPIGGEIVEVNEDLADNPQLVNEDPYGEAWLVKVKIASTDELGELLDADQYENLERDH